MSNSPFPPVAPPGGYIPLTDMRTYVEYARVKDAEDAAWEHFKNRRTLTHWNRFARIREERFRLEIERSEKALIAHCFRKDAEVITPS